MAPRSGRLQFRQKKLEGAGAVLGISVMTKSGSGEGI